MRLVFHLLSLSMINSLSLASLCSWLVDVWTLKELGIFSHLSSHFFIFALLPSRHLIPYLTRSLVARILLHMKDALPLIYASKILPCLKYFSFKTMATRKCSPVINLHSCFASIALLKFSRSLKPIPSLFLAIPNLLQLNQWILFLFPSKFYQNLVVKLVISYQRFLTIGIGS